MKPTIMQIVVVLPEPLVRPDKAANFFFASGEADGIRGLRVIVRLG